MGSIGLKQRYYQIGSATGLSVAAFYAVDCGIPQIGPEVAWLFSLVIGTVWLWVGGRLIQPMRKESG